MKKSKFTAAQISFVVQLAGDGTPVTELCRKTGMAEAIFYNLAQTPCRSDAHGRRG